MQHAGFDKLHSPQGAMLVCMSLLLLTAIIIAGSFLFRAGQRRESAARAELRKAHEEAKN